LFRSIFSVIVVLVIIIIIIIVITIIVIIIWTASAIGRDCSFPVLVQRPSVIKAATAAAAAGTNYHEACHHRNSDDNSEGDNDSGGGDEDYDCGILSRREWNTNRSLTAVRGRRYRGFSRVMKVTFTTVSRPKHEPSVVVRPLCQKQPRKRLPLQQTADARRTFRRRIASSHSVVTDTVADNSLHIIFV